MTVSALPGLCQGRAASQRDASDAQLSTKPHDGEAWPGCARLRARPWARPTGIEQGLCAESSRHATPGLGVGFSVSLQQL